MNACVLCVGSLKEDWQKQGTNEYLKRLSRLGRVEEIELNDLPEPAVTSEAIEEQIRRKEGEAILQKLKPGDHVIAMTIPGRQHSSPELAEKLEQHRLRGVPRTVFIIGGSLGLGKNVLERADEEMSMSRMTFPHQLARVMLLEQLYRAAKITAGEKYHK